MIGSLPINLILSLVFGLGQIIVGVLPAYYLLAGRRYREWRVGLLTCVGLWFVVSGVIELFVSGMESSQRLTGAPSAVTFALWRSHADSALIVATLTLALGMVAYLAYLAALRWRHAGDPAAAHDGAREHAAKIEGERSSS